MYTWHPLLSGYVFQCPSTIHYQDKCFSVHAPSTIIRISVSVSMHQPLSGYVFQCPCTIHYQDTCFSVHAPFTIIRISVSVSTHHPLSGYVFQCPCTIHYYKDTRFYVHSPSSGPKNSSVNSLKHFFNITFSVFIKMQQEERKFWRYSKHTFINIKPNW
jgi:hypothetical protein